MIHDPIDPILTLSDANGGQIEVKIHDEAFFLSLPERYR